MLDFSALDVAVGLFFLWFVLSLICSALNAGATKLIKPSCSNDVGSLSAALKRLVDNDNFYKFLVDESGYFQLQKRVDGEYSDVIEWALTDAGSRTIACR